MKLKELPVDFWSHAGRKHWHHDEILCVFPWSVSPHLHRGFWILTDFIQSPGAYAKKRFLASVFTSWLCEVSPAGPDHKSLLGPALYCADRFFCKSIANIKPLVKTRLVTGKPQMSTTWRCWSQATKRVRILPLGIMIFPLNPSSSCRYISLLAEVVRSYRHRGVC